MLPTMQYTLGQLRLVRRCVPSIFRDALPFMLIDGSLEIPQALLDQLKEGGRLVIPVGPQHGDQWLMCIDKKEGGEFVQTKLEAVRYVPLVPKKH